MRIFFKVTAGNRSGFTITEMMVTAALLMMLLAGMLSAHLFGIRMFQITKAKLGASEDARKSIAKMFEDVREGKLVKVVSGNLTGFTDIPVNTARVGTAVQINADDGTYIRYYLDSTTTQLMRTTNGTSAIKIAKYITNAVPFGEEDPSGNVLSNTVDNRVITILLKFYQIEYPIVTISPTSYYDFYEIQSKVTPRTHD